jgi:hypothetical protein
VVLKIRKRKLSRGGVDKGAEYQFTFMSSEPQALATSYTTITPTRIQTNLSPGYRISPLRRFKTKLGDLHH